MTDLLLSPSGALETSEQTTSTSPVAAYLASLQSANSRATMARQLDALAAMIRPGATRNDVPWHQLRVEHTIALRAKLLEQGSAATAKLKLAALRGILKMSWRMGLMDGEVYRRAIDMPVIRNEQPDAAAGRMLRDAELRALFDACARDLTPAGRRDAAMLALGYAVGGMRRAELVGLDLADYDPANGQFIIKGKGNKTRTAYAKGNARIALDDWLAVRGDAPGPLFHRLQAGGKTGAIGDRLSPAAIWKIYQARADQANVKHFSPHDIRRSFISHQLRAGTDLVTVAKLVGHADPKTTSGYDRRGEEAKEAAGDALHVPYRRPEQ
jgi:integrase